MPERLVLCGGAMPTRGDSSLRLSTSGPTQNIVLKLEDISRKVVDTVPDLLTDLVEIATYVYCADRATGRGGEAQRGMGAEWRRSFRFVIPVRNPAHWNQSNIVGPPCETLSFLSDDNYMFDFERAADPVPLQEYLKFGKEDDAEEVIPFSGGLDSLSGAIEELSRHGKRIALVSHRSASKIFDYQKRLLATLKTRFPRKIIYLPVLVTRQETLPAREYTQRSRSFLYATLACVVARLLGNNRIRFFENGVVSINLPISAQLVGARNTRTTHPLILNGFRNFFRAALGEPIEIDNPYIWKTKADIVRSIVSRDCGELIKDSVSCTRVHEMTKTHTHCGCCSQCLDRRFAILGAKAEEYDPAHKYKVDLLAGARDKANDKTMAESYVRTALELRELNDMAFFSRYGGETARVLPYLMPLSADEVGRRVLELHQRHAQTIWDVLKAAIETNSAEFLNGTLPASSLLMMTVSPSGGSPAINRASASLYTPFEGADGDENGGEPRTSAAEPVVSPRPLGPARPEGRKRGPKTNKLDAVKVAMRTDLRKGSHTADSLSAMLEKQLAESYGVSRETARKARTAVLSELVENPNPDK